MAETSLVFNILAKDKASSTFDKLKGKAALLGAAVAVMAIKFGKDSVSAFVEAESAQNRLSAAFDKFPALADTNIGKLQTLNKTLALKTRFDDDATASGQAVLAQFKLTGAQITEMTPLLQDYAAKTGQDLPTAAGNLGRALLGNSRGLKAIGVNFKATGDTATDFAALQAVVNEKVGGFAEKEGKTAAGQAAILRNQFGELQEQAGAHLVPALVKLAGVLLDVIGFVQKNASVLVPLIGFLGAAAGAVWAVNAATKAYTAVQAALNVVMAMNPIGLVIIAIALLVAGIVLAYQKSETFRKVVNAAWTEVAESGKHLWDILKSVFSWLVNAWLTVAGAIVDGAAAAFGWVPGIGPKLKAAASAFHEFKDSVNAALGNIKDEDVTVTIRTVAIGQGPLANKKIPAFAGGVRNFSGGMAMVGEQGPELVSLPAGSDVFSSSATRQMMGSPRGMVAGSGSTVVSVQIDGREIARAVAVPVRDELDAIARRRGEPTLAPAR